MRSFGKNPLHSLPALALLALLVGRAGEARADTTVDLELAPKAGGAAGGGQAAARAKPADDSGLGDWSRQLWTGSFDTAADASGAAAKRLDQLNFGDCQRYLQPNTGKTPQEAQVLFQACTQRQQAAKSDANAAHSIQKQQSAMSLLSKASDVAAVGAVGAVAYSELGLKQGTQVAGYDSAATIERTAATASYATGAADFTMGAYAYVAQKNKLEQMKSALTGTADGAKANDAGVTSALTDAVEAAKKAAYAHMMWGAGKLAAGYGMMYLAQQTEKQAASLQSISDLQMANSLLPPPAPAAAPQTVVMSPGAYVPPYYQNNNPQFAVPGATAASALNTGGTPLPHLTASASSGSSAPLSAANARALASATNPSSKLSGGSGSGGGAGGAAGAPGTGDSAEEPAALEKSTKEALGSSFEMQLTGGPRAFSGSSGSSKEETPNLAALAAAATDPTGSRTAATGINPSQLFQAAQSNADGADDTQAGVSGKRDSSLFELTRAKLTKMVQLGNVGVPDNVEVRN